jgi:hypothetical protein
VTVVAGIVVSVGVGPEAGVVVAAELGAAVMPDRPGGRGGVVVAAVALAAGKAASGSPPRAAG